MTDPQQFDIEDLSFVLHQRASEGGAEDEITLPPIPAEELTLRVLIAQEADAQHELDDTVHIVDTLTNEERRVYRSDRGSCYLRYRIAVLGIGEVAEAVHGRLAEQLSRAEDLLIERHGLWARYDVGLFGGRPKRGGVRPGDVELLADNLARFSPNYLLLVNAGQVRQRFADRTSRELAMLSYRVNAGATREGQRPYDMVFVADAPIPTAAFARYVQTCQRINTFPATVQFGPNEIQRMVEHARGCLGRHTERYLQPRSSPR